MNLKTIVGLVFAAAVSVSSFASTSPPPIEKVRELIKLSKTDELIKFQAKSFSDNAKKIDPKADSPAMRKRREKAGISYIEGIFAKAYTEAEIDKIITLLKSEDGKLFIKKSGAVRDLIAENPLNFELFDAPKNDKKK